MKLDRRTAIKTSLLAGFGVIFSKSGMADNCLTTSDIEGPFYIPGSPQTIKLSPPGANGTILFITGTVYARDCVTPIANAVVDVWHANDGGGYENNNYRGIIYTDAAGNYSYETVLPGKYLNGSQYRPRHLHYKVSAPHLNANFVLTTQIYFEGDTSIPIDPWASDPDAAERIIPLSPDQNGAEHGVADIILDVQPPVGIPEPAKTSTGRIESVYPNPVTSSTEITISVVQPGLVDLNIFNLNGQEVRKILEHKHVNSGRHKVPFIPQNQYGLKLSPGIYIVQMKHDGILKDAKRFVVL